MATVREGHKAALLVVDVQVGVMKEAWEAERVIGAVARTVQAARAEGVPVVWVQHADDDDLPTGSLAWQWVPALQPAATEALIHKQFNSAFENTALEATLAGLASSNWCIRATAYAALERGYDLTLVADAHSTSAMDPEDGPRIEAAAVVQELNLAMTWLRYPGRRNAVVATAQLRFTAA